MSDDRKNDLREAEQLLQEILVEVRELRITQDKIFRQERRKNIGDLVGKGLKLFNIRFRR